MKIYRKTVIDMASGELEEAVTEDYSGPVALCGGSGGSQTTETKANLDPALKAAWLDGPDSALSNAQAVYKRHQENPFNDIQKMAITSMLGSLGGSAGAYNSGNALGAKALSGYGITSDIPQWQAPTFTQDQMNAIFASKKNQPPAQEVYQPRGLLYNGASKY